MHNGDFFHMENSILSLGEDIQGKTSYVNSYFGLW